ncbi:MAG: hypothetical protein AABM30_11550 [Actinomycetota bacterium]
MSERGAMVAQTGLRNQCGRAVAMTVANPIRPGRSVMLRFNFWLSRRVPALAARLRKLSFIHFARWTIVNEFPYNGAPQERETLKYKYLFFISNYNGYFMQYIDAFCHVVRFQMDWIWGNTYFWTKGAPAGATKRTTRRLEFVASHYYGAYPEASATMILSALALKPRFDAFHASVDGGSAEDFHRAYQRFVTDVQKYL